ncbi:tRNA (adenosine(37)-N6)-threonylcarbamoyltransferase complex dimerization subunit type 1 TsaB [Bifidobacterium oedipodis]|uniref:tRNA threonylcarbamoyladenosine biosynthesis protein TsaB n=1 Tax=Bifidobacterium oedipodis TaxID=2675322 RepID=A0A7Y0EQ05_9BIFI|nr:tRNA (adenosine(37)-N6)-threonylcarbamoyltransferase complex dimerization subunit type 1 TsaB [Bifidobacterium sp. DSM 109957]NMM94326.1 tRNA threonylcarbamoyladenosine biosynthesis protein TsaB [Bifidobacterium sp. DSM 109957]
MTDQGERTNTNTLVIDTSYGSTVGVVGHEPIVETDSRTHVERLQVNITRACAAAGLASNDLDRIVVGVGPAPFTGLRAGIVAAKALAFATGAELLGQNILEPQVLWNLNRHGHGDAAAAQGNASQHVLTLAINDARRKQLYFELLDDSAYGDETEPNRGHRPLIAMDIDYPEQIVERVNAANSQGLTVDVIGHGAGKYESVLRGIAHVGDIVDASVLDQGAMGLTVFAQEAERRYLANPNAPVEPLYLRRPDAEVPNPLKHVLGHAGANRA